MGKSVIMHALMSLMLHGDHEPTPTPTPEPSGCFYPYGCFATDGVWAGSERPVSLYPMPPDAIMPTFCLHTPARPNCHVLGADNLSTLHSTSLHHSTPLYLLTHGYMESAELEWVVELVGNLLLTSRNVGVVTVDWSQGAQPPYAQAVANIRLVGAITGHLLGLVMEELGMSSTSVHLVGHSLGAHLMGYAADHLSSTVGHKVGHIIGLDPAGPYFTNTPPEVRLDASDASFVDVIHTDVPTHDWELNKLGYPDAMGHVDFYPNGGSQQAGCQGSAAVHIDRKETLAGGVLSYIGCSHQRSYQFFAESIVSRCKFIGMQCSSWEEYRSGTCWGCDGGQCYEMGLPTMPPHHQEQRKYSPIILADHQGTAQSNGEPGYNGAVAMQNESSIGEKENEMSKSVEDNIPPSPVKVFLGTNAESPFCAEQYRVTLVTANTPEAIQAGGDVVRFTVTLLGHHDTLTIPAPTRPSWVEAGERAQWVGWGSEKLGILYNMRVEFEEDHGLLHALIWRFSPPTLYIDSFIVEVLSSGAIFHFPFCGRPMVAGESYTLLPDTTCDQ